MAKIILLVDDEFDLLTVTKIRLEASGYEVWKAGSGEEAIEILKNKIPDLILLDLLLPNIQGNELCKKLKADEKFKQTPVIIFTASVLRLSEVAKEIGADDYIQKPFESKELLTKIRKQIG